MLINVYFAFQPNYFEQVFGSDYFAGPNLLSFFCTAVIVATISLYLIRFRRKIPLAGMLCVEFGVLTPQVLFLSDMRLHAAVALYVTVTAYLIYYRFWVIYVRQTERQMNNERMKKLVILHQIRPHFIFNCLGSIEALCEIDPHKAQSAVSELAHILRSTMENLESEERKTFSQIIPIVESYVQLEQMRFGARIRLELDVEETDFTLPPFIVQPLVENAIKHGLAKKQGGGTVTVATRRDGDAVEIRVSDNGVGMDGGHRELDDRAHIGLTNVEQRLKLLCNGSMTVESAKNAGTAIILRIPLEGNR